jgi:hypothetical protein
VVTIVASAVTKVAYVSSPHLDSSAVDIARLTMTKQTVRWLSSDATNNFPLNQKCDDDFVLTFSLF